MTNKTKKITLLTAGIAGTLLASSVAAVTLSACTIQAALPPNYVDQNKPTPTPSVQYNTEINWNIQTNEDWELGMPLPVNKLEQDENGFIYADKNHTQLIAMLPSIKVSEITIPAQVQQISGYVDKTTNTSGTHKAAFQGNTNLRTVKFAPGSKLKAINTNAFKGCSNLQTIQLPSTVKTIHNNAFENTNNLTSINLDNINYIGASTFKNSFASVASINLELKLNNVLRIGESAFENVSNVKAIDLGKNSKLLSIGANAFKGAKLAETFDLSNSKALATIGDSAFENTTNVQTIKLPETFGFSSTPLGTAVFKNSSITSIDLSQTQIKSIPNNTFESAANLADVKLNDEITTFGDASFTKTASLKTLILPSKLSNINKAFQEDFVSENALIKSGITELDFSNTQVTEFPSNSFEGAQNLIKIILNDKLTTIGNFAFRNARSLSTLGPLGTQDGTLKLPASFTTFSGTHIFQGSQLINVDLSETNITNLSHAVFNVSRLIQSIKYPNTLTTLSGGNGSLQNIVNADLSNTKITAIPNDAFRNAQKLESVILPNTVTSIGNNAFDNTNISEIELPEKVRTIGNYAFANTKKLKSITFKESNSTTPSYKTTKANNGAVFSSYINSIGEGAFLGSVLELIDLSNTKIRNIPSFAFGENEVLTTIYVPNTIETLERRIFANAGTKYTPDNGLISNSKLTTFGTKEDLGITDGTTRASDPKVILPSSVKHITDNTFEYSGISDIDLSKITSFMSIGDDLTDDKIYGLSGMGWMFNGATQLKTVVLPNWVKGKISANMFNNTKSLMSVTVAGFPTASTYDGEEQIAAGTFDISQSNISGFDGGWQFRKSNLGIFKFPEKFDRTTIPESAFEGTKLTEVKVQTSATKAPIDNNILDENTTTISDNAFSNIPTLATIELPSSLTSINNNAFSNIAPNATMTFTNGVNLPTETTETATNAFANSLVNEVNLSGSTGLTTISPGTFNGASGLNKITLPAKAVKWKTAESGSGASKVYSNNPLFNNDNALNIEFTMFTKDDGNAPDQFSDIGDNTKQQIANIMNMFSNYTSIATAHPVQYSNWEVRDGQSPINSWINADLTKDNVFSNWTKDGADTNIDANTMTGATIAHNGVTWVYEKDTNGNITIKTQTTSPASTINMYRTITGNDTDWDDTNGKFKANQGRQTYFSAPLNNANGAPNSNVRVTVTMKIVVKP